MAQDDVIDSISDCGESEQANEHTYNRMDFRIDGTTLVKYTSKRPTVVVPEFVTEIGDKAFYECGYITSVTLPEGLVSIGESAFEGCVNLTGVKLPLDLKTIGNKAFGRSGLTEIDIPFQADSVGDEAFYECSQLISANIASNASFGEKIFAKCDGLKRVNLYGCDLHAVKGTNVEVLRLSPSNCSCVCDDMPMLREVDLRGAYISICPETFSSCSGLERLYISYRDVNDADNKPIPQGAFSALTSLKELMVPELDENGIACMFDGNVPSSLKKVTVNGGIIPYEAFKDCEQLETVIFGDAVTCIWNSAFDGCSGLKEVFIPESVAEMGNYVFAGCKDVIVFCGAEKQPVGWDEDWNAEHNLVFWNSELTADGGLFGERQASPLSDFEVVNDVLIDYKGNGGDAVVPGSIKTIGEDAFGGFDGLTNITLLKGVKEIAMNAIHENEDLVSLVISESVNSIHDSPVYSCRKLSEIYVNKKNKKYYVENKCLIEKTTKKVLCCGSGFVLPTDGSIKILGHSLFYENDGLSTLTVPNGVTEIMDYCFAYCGNLESIDIPASVKSFGEEAFSECKQLTVINYGGKKAQWKKIATGACWDYGTGDYTVHCTDGDIHKDE